MAERTAAEHTVAGVVHIHSDYSHDGRDSLEELREWSIERGIRFVGLTDHAEDFAPELWDDYVDHCRALSDEKVVLIPGLEFRFRGFTGLHLLAVGLERWIEPETPAEFCELARGSSRLTIMAHPVLARWQLPDAVRQCIDAVEIWNASYNTRYLPDPRAMRLLAEIRHGRPEVVGTVGLDQHDRRNDRETRTLVAPDGDLIAKIRAGEFTSRGRTMRLDPAAQLTPLAAVGLSVARWALDAGNAMHEQVVRLLRRRAARRKRAVEAG